MPYALLEQSKRKRHIGENQAKSESSRRRNLGSSDGYFRRLFKANGVRTPHKKGQLVDMGANRQPPQPLPRLRSYELRGRVDVEDCGESLESDFNTFKVLSMYTLGAPETNSLIESNHFSQVSVISPSANFSSNKFQHK